MERWKRALYPRTLTGACLYPPIRQASSQLMKRYAKESGVPAGTVVETTYTPMNTGRPNTLCNLLSTNPHSFGKAHLFPFVLNSF